MTSLTTGGVGSHDTGDPSTGRRERKKLQTRQALHTHALRLFAERGFDATTVLDITEAADVSQRTFFLHYASKEDVLLGDTAERARDFLEALAARPAGESAYAALRGTILDSLNHEDDREVLMLKARLMDEAPSLLARNLEQHAEIAQLIAHDASRRSGHDAQHDIYPTLIASAVMTALATSISLWYRRGASGPLRPVVVAALVQLEHGLADPITQP